LQRHTPTQKFLQYPPPRGSSPKKSFSECNEQRNSLSQAKRRFPWEIYERSSDIRLAYLLLSANPFFLHTGVRAIQKHTAFLQGIPFLQAVFQSPLPILLAASPLLAAPPPKLYFACAYPATQAIKIRASRCCCAAVQKGHMIEQVTNKRNQRARGEITQRKKVVDSLIYRKD